MKNWKIEKMAREIVLSYFNSVLPDAFFAGDINQYRGRLIFENKQQTIEFINLIDWLNAEFGLTGHYIVKVIIEQYDIKELEYEG